MDSAKNRVRNKLCLCFRPVAVDDRSLKPDCTNGSGDPVFSYISVQRKEKMVLPKILTALSEKRLKVSSDGGGRTKEKSRRSFSRMLNAVLFETSLGKKVRNRKDGKNSFQSENHSAPEKTKNVSNAMNENPTPKDSSEAEDPRLDSSRWPPMNSSIATASTSLWSSRDSSVTSSSKSLTEGKGSFRANPSVKTKQVNRSTSTEKVSELHSSNIGFCLLLICLLALIFWGKVFAIFCTSMSLFLVPSLIKRISYPVNGVDSPVNVIDSPEIDAESEAYKKRRVVMEGLLERHRSWVTPQVR
ncbi:hypothetical protein U1Q18_000592 [Sarracenia purpurea var. burkii]